ncbi:DUF3551 domain-containing protein [Undibacter mobilis]|nr:DUF3551 domain-containing protein [Undibacter mobilis]
MPKKRFGLDLRLPLSAAMLLALVIASAASLQAISPARAGVEYPWCAVYSEWSVGATNCGFTTLAQCRATISGVGGMCVENPAYQPPAPRKPRKPRH